MCPGKIPKSLRISSLTRIFIGNILESQGCKDFFLVDVQAELSLRWAHILECTVSNIAVQIDNMSVTVETFWSVVKKSDKNHIYFKVYNVSSLKI